VKNGRILKALVAAMSVAWLGGCESGATPASVAVQQTLQTGGLSLVDGGRGRIWTLTRAGLFLSHVASVERRPIALPDWVAAGEPYGSQPALAFGPGGDVLVTSDIVPVVWRVDPRTGAVSVHRPTLDAHQDKDFGFTSLAYSARDGAFVATSSMPNARWRIDAALTRAELISSLPLNYSGGM
jgi:hypothetical protein